jgi:hypothetical protein
LPTFVRRSAKTEFVLDPLPFFGDHRGAVVRTTMVGVHPEPAIYSNSTFSVFEAK